MSELFAMSTGIDRPPVSGNTSSPLPPTASKTLGTGVIHFDIAKQWASNKPLRIRVMDDPQVEDNVNHLAEKWLSERPRGIDVGESIEAPEYQEIINLGYRAIRPLLLLMRKKPDHWFYALNVITGENPVPPDSEGRIADMASAWIKWGKQRGYLRSMD
jgi:hypothetical protein